MQLQISRHIVEVLDNLEKRIERIEKMAEPRIIRKIGKKEN
jgi:hypothetical protein